MKRRPFEFPKLYEPQLEVLLQRIGFSLREPKALAHAVMKLSDHYTQNPLARTPWQEPWAQAASLAYYFPLNYARAQAVAIEGQRLGFFVGLQTMVDFGSGMGSALHAFLDHAAQDFSSAQASDVSDSALELGRSLCLDENRRTLLRAKPPRNANRSGVLAVGSYVLTELQDLPELFSDRAEAIAIIEPATQEDGRKLMLLREKLISIGFRIWGPCTHEGPCPLLHHSAKDWCHDRIHWHAPDWFLAMEKNLPIKNRTLTFSYLLARRPDHHLPPKRLQSLARSTGDMLEEKGKTRQSVCRGPEREFLAWFPQRMKAGEEINLERGALLELSGSLERKSNELRARTPLDVRALGDNEKI